MSTLYCGRAVLAANYKAHADADAWYMDWDKEAVKPSFSPYPEYRPLHEGGTIKCLNGLDENNFIHLDFLDFAMGVISGELNIGDLHAIHDGLDCSTFTDMASASSQRRPENAFMGTSVEAYATNLRYHFLAAFHLFLKQNGQTQHCARSAENPTAARQYHPLTLNVLEKPKADGGLSMAKVEVSFCQVMRGPAPQKNTHFWESHPETLKIFVNENGEPCKTCHSGNQCRHFGSHRNGIRPGKGEEGDARRGSVYPDEVCTLLVTSKTDLFGQVRQLALDPANTADGNNDKCARCGNALAGGKTWNCDGCPDCYHRRCIPSGPGWTRPREGDPYWYCGKPDCQRAKERRENGGLTAAEAQAAAAAAQQQQEQVDPAAMETGE